ncbi:HAD superfamily hydrolase (TIGR01450 family)/HAD superfamily hydrolase (TIGR01549 family) [Tamaricihabitans halophyticus]|uniref:HAD superfamily hydrolase (TIGR01450 family)/HAD superfamily hydrolase (TIGR01549 family) n=1 Tax=Tamaricihabitans halophyticus TaxID=1262583 RepID=A0A4R2PVG2_9PSEU|nr:HAD-IIA family hydrolase [Tamaricihabitans halophyticus]TCP39224.1 HAD superfamily hydrolase (TIGR01450 family)/HAD superfamily hydrolase (TIGR01549 family) [Tamaricihabitans halophyticus]
MTALLDSIDALLLDLDGTVYHGEQVIAGAADTLDEARTRGRAIQFVTNNASRAPEDVARQLTGLRITARPEDVSTSAQAAAALLRTRLTEGDTVYVLGAEALAAEVRDQGLRPMTSKADQVAAVVQGFSPTIGWPQLAEACMAIRTGASWVACNGDVTLPTERGMLPGNGALVAALAAATDRTPTVAGKPERPLFEQALAASGTRHALVVGDRLDTDIAGARNAGLTSLAVLSGVSSPRDILAAPPAQRPDHLSTDISGLLLPIEQTRIPSEQSSPDPFWEVQLAGTTLRVETKAAEGAPVDLLRMLCAAWWPHRAGAPDAITGDRQALSLLTTLGIPATPASRG